MTETNFLFGNLVKGHVQRTISLYLSSVDRILVEQKQLKTYTFFSVRLQTIIVFCCSVTYAIYFFKLRGLGRNQLLTGDQFSLVFFMINADIILRVHCINCSKYVWKRIFIKSDHDMAVLITLHASSHFQTYFFFDWVVLEAIPMLWHMSSDIMSRFQAPVRRDDSF